jgi:DNA-binding MarR family transcriptional regulator
MRPEREIQQIADTTEIDVPAVVSRSVDITWERYRDNLPRHLIGLARDLQARVMQSLRCEHGHQELRQSFGPFLSLIWDKGRPITAIAGELSISKQACSQLANLVERAGYLERIPNPVDRRSKLVRLTREGRELVEQGAALILETESEYAAIVTPGPYQAFTAALADLYRGLGLVAQAVPAATADRSHSAGVLPLVVERIQALLMQAAMERGHTGLKMSHGQVLPLIGPGGGRIHEIARVHGVSRQAISAISQDLEAQGYLLRTPDAFDRRGVVLTLTQKGQLLIRDSVAAVDDLELSLIDILGSGPLAHLRRVAHDLYHALHLEEAIFADKPEGQAATSPEAVRDSGRKIQQLANRLRRRLGSGDAAHLAELLETRVRTTAT